MTAAGTRPAEALFLEALDLAPEEREAFVTARAGDESRLRAEVLSLLRSHDAAGSFLAEPALAPPASEGESVPRRFGDYEILGILGEGGMGVVYLARQRNPSRCVALKVLRPGTSTPRLLRRFEHEAEILGRLRHPGIAQIHEAGTADDGHGPQPFFAMEWVRGPTLLAHAREHALQSRERLVLLADVCDAVDHAHRSGIVHRDLKPSNILVDRSGDRPQVKVLDFGVARTLAAQTRERTFLTEAGQIVGTLPYMSPEQAAGDAEAVDMRADVYALGAIGYELLGGRVPLAIGGVPLHEGVRIVCEAEPTPLGEIAPAWRGDVETLIAKALEKDPSRRYASAAALGRDLRNHLADLPIDARPPSTAYVVAKFARRHRTLVLGLAAVILALVLGIAGTATQALRASEESRRVGEEKARVLREAARATRVADTFRSMLARALPEELGREVKLVDVIDSTAAELSKELGDAPEIEADVRQTLGQTYFGLGDLGQAEREFAACVDLRRRALGESARETLVGLLHQGHVLLELDRTAEAEAALDRVLEGLRALGGENDPDAIDALALRGLLEERLGRLDAAEADLRREIELRRELGTRTSEYAAGLSNLGSLLMGRGRLEEAETLQREALEIGVAIDGEMHPGTLRKLNNLAGVLQLRGRLEEASDLYRRALEIGRRIQGERHQETVTRMNNLASVLHSTGELAEAESLYRGAVDLLSESMGPEHVNTLLAEGNLALLLSSQGRNDEAEPLLRREVDAFERTLGQDDVRTIRARYNLASVLRELGAFDEAYRVLDAAVLAAEGAMAPGSWEPALFRTARGRCLLQMRRVAEAESDMRRGYEELEAALGPSHWRTRMAAEGLVELYSIRGETHCEREWREVVESAR